MVSLMYVPQAQRQVDQGVNEVGPTAAEAGCPECHGGRSHSSGGRLPWVSRRTVPQQRRQAAQGVTEECPTAAETGCPGCH